MKILAATGHRPHKLRREWDGTGPLSLWIQGEMRKILEREKPDAVITGMALGADQIWAELAVIMNIRLIAAIPFFGQEARWHPDSQNKYRILLAKAQEIVNVSDKDHYKASYMQDRNEWMVDQSSGLVAVWDESPGGTFNCVMYAQNMGRPIFHIDPRHFTDKEFEDMDL